jgi:hypothetical protein
MLTQLLEFLQKDLEIPADSLRLALNLSQPTLNQLPMILWQYGLISLEQLDRIFDWLETA